MAITNHVDISISADSVGVARAGFGIPLIASGNAGFAGVRSYSRLSDIISDGFPSDSPEVRAATAFFSQVPRVRQVLIGKVSAPTQVYTVVPEQVIEPDHTYVLNVVGQGFESTEISYETTDDDDEEDIVDGLVISANLVAGKNYTATKSGSGASAVLVLTGDDPGNWFSVDSPVLADLSVSQTHGAGTIADDLSALSDVNDSWYGLVTLYNSEAYVLAVAAWVQATTKMYWADSADSADRTEVSDGSSGILDKLAAAGYTRTVPIYYHSSAGNAAAAAAGTFLPRDPGSVTLKFRRPIGVPPTILTGTERANLIARHANIIERVRGLAMIAEGTTSAGPSVLGGFVDEVRDMDFIKDDMEARLLEALAGSAKLPRTDAGMVPLEAAVRATLKHGVELGIIAELTAEQNGGVPSPNVEVPLVSDMGHLLPRGTQILFSFKLAGAIHKVNVTGVIYR